MENTDEPVDLKKGVWYYEGQGPKQLTRYLDALGTAATKEMTDLEKKTVENIKADGREPYYLGDGSWIATRAQKGEDGFYTHCFLCGVKNKAVISYGERGNICLDCFTD